MRIVYCGELWAGGTCSMRADTLRMLGHQVVEIDTTHVATGMKRQAVRVLRKLGHIGDPVGANSKVLEAAARHKPQVVWIDKGLSIKPDTLIALRSTHPEIQIVHYSPDDMAGRHNQSRQYLECVPLFDLHVTTKSFNVEELHALGARDVLFVNNAYAVDIHRPIEISHPDRLVSGGEVGFIGAFEMDRAQTMLFLARHGVHVRVWGGGWETWATRNFHSNMRIENRCLWGEDCVRAICSFAINLGFLRKLNRDLQTTRSIEIPASGGFMLAERTSEHLALFKEGVEAEFFSSKEELLEKCLYYLTHSEERQKIGAAGRERCVQSGYSYDRQVEAVLDHLDRLQARAR